MYRSCADIVRWDNHETIPGTEARLIEVEARGIAVQMQSTGERFRILF